MKKVILFFSLLFCFSNIFATPINKIIFFGDSLTDDGNLYRLLFNIIPKSPPYFKGRFSNGPTWAEHVGKYYYDKYSMDYKIYALGGATCIQQFTSRFLSPALLEMEVNLYLLEALFQDKSSALYLIWIGGNDYIYGDTTDLEKSSSTIVDKITSMIRKLIAYGGENFVVFNLPDLSKIPLALEENSVEKLRLATVLNNQKLAQAIIDIQNEYPQTRVVLMDVNRTFRMLTNEPEKFNKKYNIHIKNTGSSCWTGKMWLNKVGSEQTLKQDVTQALMKNNMTKINETHFATLGSFIFTSPVMSHVYELGKLYEMGVMPCVNADDYIFWDGVHPTSVIHKVLGKIVVNKINKELGNKMMASKQQ